MGRTAVLGLGNIGTRHLTLLKDIGDDSPIGISRRSSRRTELNRLGYETAETLTQALRIGADKCIIATETGTHISNIKEAIECGMHILVEKPLGTDLDQSRFLPDVLNAEGILLYVGCVLRFWESLNVFRARLETIGPLHYVTVEHRSYMPNWRINRSYKEMYSALAKEGGVLLDLIHEIDLTGWIFGWPKLVQGNVLNLGRLGINSDESVQLLCMSPVDVPIYISLDYLSNPPSRRVIASGDKGTIEWDGVGNSVSVALSDQEVCKQEFDQPIKDAFLQQSSAFLKACNGEANPRMADVYDGLRALSVCDAARKSSETRKEEVVELI